MSEKLTIDQANYKAYVLDRQKNGWSVANVEEYKTAVGICMGNGSDEDKADARQFWALKKLERDYSTAEAITSRIKASIEQARDEMKEAA